MTIQLQGNLKCLNSDACLPNMSSEDSDSWSDITHCAICLGQLNEPRSLPCLHAFCTSCLAANITVTMAKAEQPTNSFPCPTCRLPTALPNNGVSGFTKDFKSEKISKILKKVAKIKNTGNCYICFDDNTTEKATIFCCDCQRYFCDVCRKKHDAKSIFLSHFTVDFPFSKSKNAVPCLQHSGEAIQFYCEKCKLGVCTLCTFKDHDNHELSTLEENYAIHQAELMNYIQKLDQKIWEIHEILFNLTCIEGKIKSMYKDCRYQLKKDSRKLAQRIMGNESKLLSEVEENYRDKIEKLSQNKNQHQKQLRQYEQLRQRIETFLINYKPAKILYKYPDILESSKSFSLAQQFKEFRESMGMFVKFVPGTMLTPGKFEWVPLFHSKNFKQIERPEANSLQISPKVSPTHVMHMVQGNTPTPCRQEFDNTTTEATTTGNSNTMNLCRNGNLRPSPRKNCLVSAPNIVSRHSSIISASSVYSSRLVASPFSPSQGNIKAPVCAKLQCQIGEFGRGPGQLSLPYSVCFAQDGQIVVAENGNKRLQMFNLDGQSTGYLGEDDIIPRCLATTDGKQIAVTDELSKTIKILNKDKEGSHSMACIKSLSFPYGLTINNVGHFILTDMIYENVVILDQTGKMVMQFGCHGNGNSNFDNPTSVAATTDKILVSDSGNHTVKVFDNNGRFLYKFGGYGSEKGCLCYPKSLVCNGDRIYVADSGNDRIVIFSILGKYLGSLLTREYGIRHPVGLAYDKERNLLAVTLPDSHEVNVYELCDTVTDCVQ